MLIVNKHKQTIRFSNYFFSKLIFISIVYQNIDDKNTIIYYRLRCVMSTNTDYLPWKLYLDQLDIYS